MVDSADRLSKMDKNYKTLECALGHLFKVRRVEQLHF